MSANKGKGSDTADAHTSPEGGASEKKVSQPRIKMDFYFWSL